MTQYGYEPLSPDDSGSTLLERVNGVVPALLTNHKGAARPAYVQPGMMWIDDSGATWLLNLFDGAGDAPIAAIDPETHKLVASFVPLTRKLRLGSGLALGGLVGTDEEPAEGDLSEDRLITQVFATLEQAKAGTATKVPVDPAGVAAAISALGTGGLPVGSILLMPHTVTPPGGYLAGNGAAVSRAAYAALDAAMYVGDAANPTAAAWYRCTNSASPAASRSVTGDYIVLPDLRGVFPRFLDDGRNLDAGRVVNTYQADLLGSHAHSWSINTGGNGGTGLQKSTTGNQDAVGGTTGAAGGSETRPKNIAVRGWIKF